jgi:hypothetical protein
MKNAVRASLLVFTTLCVSVFMPSAWPKQPAPGFEIGTLSTELYDVGCYLLLRKQPWSAEPIFLSNVNGNLIRINGQQITLTRIEEDADTVKGWEKFVAPDVQVLVKYGRGHQNEGGETYKRVTLKVIYKAQTKIIPAKGGCGC